MLSLRTASRIVTGARGTQVPPTPTHTNTPLLHPRAERVPMFPVPVVEDAALESFFQPPPPHPPRTPPCRPAPLPPTIPKYPRIA